MQPRPKPSKDGRLRALGIVLTSIALVASVTVASALEKAPKPQSTSEVTVAAVDAAHVVGLAEPDFSQSPTSQGWTEAVTDGDVDLLLCGASFIPGVSIVLKGVSFSRIGLKHGEMIRGALGSKERTGLYAKLNKGGFWADVYLAVAPFGGCAKIALKAMEGGTGPGGGGEQVPLTGPGAPGSLKLPVLPGPVGAGYAAT
jgi:hypothetical protein